MNPHPKAHQDNVVYSLSILSVTERNFSKQEFPCLKRKI